MPLDIEEITLPGTLAESFPLLERHRVIDGTLAERLRRAAGFRDIVVHRYADVDPREVERIVKNDLGVLRDFVLRVANRFGLR